MNNFFIFSIILYFANTLQYHTIIHNKKLLLSSNNTNTTLLLPNQTKLKLKNITNELNTNLNKNSKFCHIKCNCFFSHSVVNDNINVKYNPFF
jgi:hypothetical protein|tara:strand:- start:1320 stop:1598 length:279 start_codon:yes stop_codon:yes gene_type:complete